MLVYLFLDFSLVAGQGVEPCPLAYETSDLTVYPACDLYNTLGSQPVMVKLLLVMALS